MGIASDQVMTDERDSSPTEQSAGRSWRRRSEEVLACVERRLQRLPRAPIRPGIPLGDPLRQARVSLEHKRSTLKVKVGKLLAREDGARPEAWREVDVARRAVFEAAAAFERRLLRAGR